MPQSEVDICNVALAEIGAEIIENFQDTSQTARLCRLFYDRSRDELLSEYRWNFALKRANLTLLTETPVYEFDNAYQLPTDLLRVWDTSLGSEAWRIEDNVLLTDADEVCILYSARVEDVGKFSMSFRRTLELRVAASLALPLTREPSIANLFMNKFQEQLANARAYDSQENSPEVTGPGDEILITSRVSSSRGFFGDSHLNG